MARSERSKKPKREFSPTLKGIYPKEYERDVYKGIFRERLRKSTVRESKKKDKEDWSIKKSKEKEDLFIKENGGRQ